MAAEWENKFSEYETDVGATEVSENGFIQWLPQTEVPTGLLSLNTGTVTVSPLGSSKTASLVLRVTTEGFGLIPKWSRPLRLCGGYVFPDAPRSLGPIAMWCRLLVLLSCKQ
jgi:hypothetical protein